MGRGWRVVKEDGRRKEKAMDATNKDCPMARKLVVRRLSPKDFNLR